MMLNGVQLITFDADDTLWDFTAMATRGTAAVADTIAGDHPDLAHLTTEVILQLQVDALRRANRQTVDFTQMRRTVFTKMLKKYGHQDAPRYAEHLLALYLQTRDGHREFWPDTYSTLDALRERYRLGYITNGTTQPDHVELTHYFDVVVTPETLGIRKPRREVFDYAAESLGLTTADMLHIGDNLFMDVDGAIQAGAQGVWFNPHANENWSVVLPSAEIRALGDVLALLS